MHTVPHDDPDDFADRDSPADLDDFERADPFGHAVIILAVRRRHIARVLVGQWLWSEGWLREVATPDVRAAHEAAIDLGLAHLRRYREVPELLDHLWNDPQCVAPRPGATPRLVEPPWIAEACRLHGGEHRLSTMTIEAIAYGRRLAELVREHLHGMLL